MADEHREDGTTYHREGARPAERGENEDAPAEGGSVQGVGEPGARGTRSGGMAAEEDVGMEGGGLTGARGSDGETAPNSE